VTGLTIVQCDLHSKPGRRPVGARFCTPPSFRHFRKSRRMNEIHPVLPLPASEGTAIAMGRSTP